MNLELERIALHAERLNLHIVADIAPLIAEEAAAKNQSYTEFLERVLRSEAEAADSRATDMIMKTASFPFVRTLEDFDFSFQASVSRKQVRELASCAFIGRKENLIFLGPPGVGKSHLAVALGLEAAKHRLKVKFTTCADMVASLASATRGGTYTNRLRTYVRPSLLIIDEIGFFCPWRQMRPTCSFMSSLIAMNEDRSSLRATRATGNGRRSSLETPSLPPPSLIACFITQRPLPSGARAIV